MLYYNIMSYYSATQFCIIIIIYNAQKWALTEFSMFNSHDFLND